MHTHTHIYMHYRQNTWMSIGDINFTLQYPINNDSEIVLILYYHIHAEHHVTTHLSVIASRPQPPECP